MHSPVSRERSIDVMKGLLLAGMATVHVHQVLGDSGEWWVDAAAGWVFAVTFPGFLFCFGYSAHGAYLSKPWRVASGRMLAAAVRIMAAFYLSAIGCRLLLAPAGPFRATLPRVLTLQDLPPFSEFLPSFAALTVLTVVLFHPLRRLLDSRRAYWGVTAGLLGFACVPPDAVGAPQLGVLVSTDRYPSFPALAYAPYYLLGLGAARHRWPVAPAWLGWAAACAVPFAVGWLVAGIQPSRFPASLPWVLVSVGPVLLYFAAARWLADRTAAVPWFERAGRGTLFHLVGSNLAVFALAAGYPDARLPWAETLGVAVGILAGLTCLAGFAPRPAPGGSPRTAGGDECGR